MRGRRFLAVLASATALTGAAPGRPFGGETSPAGFRFSVHRIDAIGSQLGQTALVDVDRDGDLDWISGQADRTGGEVWWWEYRGPDDWVRHSMGRGHTDVGGAAHDVNGDGFVDFLAGSRLLLSTGRPRVEEFTAHDVGTIYSHDTAFADIDGDGTLDALANSDRSGLFWYTVPKDPKGPWSAHPIASASEHNVHGGAWPRPVGDLDGDGDSDVVTGQGWYENRDGRGLSWRPHLNLDLGEAHQYGLAVRTWVGDLDGDGDNDVVQAEADNPDGRVAFFENDGRGEWTRHLIKAEGDGQDFHSLAVADFDGDGDLDVFSCGGPLSSGAPRRAYVWENEAGPGGRPSAGRWEEHVVAEKPCHEAVAGDVDGDGDVDLAFKPWTTGNEHVYLQNRRIDPSPRPAVFLNHFYVVVDAGTYAAVQASGLMTGEFAPFEKRTTTRNDTRYTGIYWYGRRTYFELFEPGAQGPAGASTAVKQAWDRVLGPAGAGPVTRKTEADEVPWFEMTYAREVPGLRVWLMEYHRDFLARFYPALTGARSVERSDVLDRYVAKIGQGGKREAALLRDVTGLRVALSRESRDALATQLRAAGWTPREEGGALVAEDPESVVVRLVDAGKEPPGITEVAFSLQRAVETASHRLGTAELRLEGRTARLLFRPAPSQESTELLRARGRREGASR